MPVHGPKKPTKEERDQLFWSKVDVNGDDECWEWKASKSYGYGQFWIGKTFVGSHRYAWEFSNGHIPEGMLVCHKCDNPACCNPKHLFLGTIQDNINDKVIKGRHENQYTKAKLNTITKLENFIKGMEEVLSWLKEDNDESS